MFRRIIGLMALNFLTTAGCGVASDSRLSAEQPLVASTVVQLQSFWALPSAQREAAFSTIKNMTPGAFYDVLAAGAVDQTMLLDGWLVADSAKRWSLNRSEFLQATQSFATVGDVATTFGLTFGVQQVRTYLPTVSGALGLSSTAAPSTCGHTAYAPLTGAEHDDAHEETVDFYGLGADAIAAAMTTAANEPADGRQHTIPSSPGQRYSVQKYSSGEISLLFDATPFFALPAEYIDSHFMSHCPSTESCAVCRSSLSQKCEQICAAMDAKWQGSAD